MTDQSDVRRVRVSAEQAGQRLDNFLLAQLKGVPRSHIYKILRSGEVRVNKGRARAHQKLALDDEVRIPPVRMANPDQPQRISDQLDNRLRQQILFSDDALIAINKPAGMAVHGGSGVSLGLIEALRQVFPNEKRLELVHRLDRETSGCLLLARSRQALLGLQDQLQSGGMGKHYQALCVGQWPRHVREVDAPLDRSKGAAGERIVRAAKGGKAALTRFRVVQRYADATLLDAQLESGRTHQIRVHAQLVGHPLVGDSKYGQRESNRHFAQLGLKRMFLHAARLEFLHPVSGEPMVVEAPLPDDLQALLARIEAT